jgi:hypothetical protein
MAHAELDRLQTCLNFALDTLRKEMDNSQLPPLSQQSSVEHPLDNSTTYLPSTGLFEARRLSLGTSYLFYMYQRMALIIHQHVWLVAS